MFFSVLRSKLRFIIYLCLFVTGTAYTQTKTLGLLKKLPGNYEDGYVLFSPIGSDTTFLMNKCGKRVHAWRSQYAPGMSVYLKPNGHLLKAGTYTDTAFGAAGGRGGIIEEFDWSGNLVWRYKVFNDSLCQHHDIKLMPNGNVLVLAWHSISKNKAIQLGRNPRHFGSVPELWGERIIELKPIGSDSAEIVWQWDLFDHVIQDYDSTAPNFGNPSQHPELMDLNYALNTNTHDWIHANSIDYNPVLDQIILSAHNISEIWIIDHSTSKNEAGTHSGGTYNKGGDFLYRWGNPEAYGYGSASDRKLFRQHNAQWIPGGMRDSGSILLFNNGWDRDTAYSTVDIIRSPILPNGSYASSLPYGPVSAAWQYKDSVPKKFYSQIISGAQMLPNGNVLICSGVQGRFFEVTEKKKIVWEYRNPVNGNAVQQDGQTAMNNAVFRCELYPAAFKGFMNKTLYTGNPIEKASLPYSCQYETIAPTVVKTIPASGSVMVSPWSGVRFQYSEAVLKRSGNIQIFSNGTLLESVSVSSDNVRISKDTVFIAHNKAFPVNSRISIKIPDNLFRDSSFNLAKGRDSSLFWFNTVKSTPELASLEPAHMAMLQKPDCKISMTFKEKIYKNNSGSIHLFADGKLLESIPITSGAIAVAGKTVHITPGAPFQANQFIVISSDSCFRDTFGQKTPALVYGDWYFRIANRPQLSAVYPGKGSKDADLHPELILELNRTVQLDRNGLIQVFANGLLLESLNLTDSNVSLKEQTLRFRTAVQFPAAARMAVSIPGNSLLDSFGLYYNGCDSAEWHFSTKAASAVSMANQSQMKLYPIPANQQLIFETEYMPAFLEIRDLCGRLLAAYNTEQAQGGSITLDLPEMASGMYLFIAGNQSRLISIRQE